MQFLIYIIFIYLIPLIAFIKLLNTYNTSNENKNSSKLSGFEIARKIMDKNELNNMYIVEKKGSFTDIYDKNLKVVKLSTPVFNEENIYSLSMSSYIASYAILSNKEDKMINLKLQFYIYNSPCRYLLTIRKYSKNIISYSSYKYNI